MRDAKGVPQDNVLVVDALGWVRGDPGGEIGVRGVGLAIGLRNVAAGGMQLIVGICEEERQCSAPLPWPVVGAHIE